MTRLRVLLCVCCGLAVALCSVVLFSLPDSPDKATPHSLGRENGDTDGTGVARLPETPEMPNPEEADEKDESVTKEEDREEEATLLFQLKEYEDRDDAAFFLLLETTVKNDLEREYPESDYPEVTARPEEADEEEEETDEEEEEETDEEEEEAEEDSEGESEEAETDEADGDEESADEEEGADEEEAEEEGDEEDDADEEGSTVWQLNPRADILSCLTKMKAAYEAYMEFARCSLSVIRETHPESYERAMATFRSALRRQCCRDLDTLRSSNLWCPCGPRPKNDEPRRDAFVHAPVRNASGFGVRGQTAYHIKLREDMLKLRQDFVAEQMQNHTLAGVEYLTNEQFEERSEEAYYEPKPTPHSKELLKLFRKAEKRWLKYSTDGAMDYHCGDGTFVGTDTHQFVYFDVIFRLWDHHEDFLLELLCCIDTQEEQEE